MKLTLCALALFSPVMSWAQLAGNWAGVVMDAQGAHRIVLHISGPFTAMKGSADIPDQKLANVPVESITFLESTLDFSVPASDARYSGVLNDNGAILGTFTQHGAGVPLVLSRVSPEVQTAVGPAGTIENGRYHDTLTAVEFDVPSSWAILRTEPAPGNPGGVRVFTDRSGKATVVTVNMAKVDLDPEGVSMALERVIPHQIAMRAGQTGAGPMHTIRDYRIRDGSVEQTSIGGHPAVRAIGEWEQNGKSFAEYLTWIYTEHARTQFVLRATAENLPSLEASLDQILQSAKIP